MSSDEQNVHHYTKDMCLLSGLFGLTFVTNRSKYSELLRNAVAVVMFLLSLYLVTYGEIAIFSQDHVFFKIQNTILLVGVQSFFLSPFVCLVQYKLAAHKLAKVTRLLAHICDVHCLFPDSLHKRLRRLVLVAHLILLLDILILTADIHTNNTFKRGLSDRLGVIITEMWMFIPTLHFFCWNLLLRYLFSQVNMSLLQSFLPRKTANIDNLSINNKFYLQPFASKLKKRKLLRAFKTLLWAKERINRIYGSMLIVYLWCSSIIVVFNCYQIIILQYTTHLLLYLRLLITVMCLFSIFWICENVSRLVRSCAVQLLCAFVTSTEYSGLDRQARNFCFTLRSSCHMFRVCDLLNLNYKTYLSLMSIAVAYVIVELQLHSRDWSPQINHNH